MSNPDEYTEDVDIDLPEEVPGKAPRKRREAKRVSDWLKERKPGTKLYKRVANAHKKHPGWSLEELRYGYKSKRAAAYRERRVVPGGEIDYQDLAQSFRDSGLVVIGRNDYDEEYYAKLILARDHKRLFAYGGLIRYDPGRDKSKPQSDLAAYVIGEIKRRVRSGKR